MKTILLYLIQVIACSGLLYGYYHFILRNSKFHQYNRYYLWFTAVISVAIPFFQIPVYVDPSATNPAVIQTLTAFSAGSFEDNPGALPAQQGMETFPFKNIFSFFYILVSIFLFTRFLYALWSVVRLIKVYPGEKIDDINFVQTTDPSSPFSFFRWLFWNRDIELNSDDGQQIFRHEMFHIRQKHSLDIVVFELITILFWVNPFFHLLKKEIRTIHEFLADRFAVRENREWDYAELLLMQVLRPHSSRLTNPFFHNQIKRRITMLTTSKKPGYQYLRKMMALPLAAILVGLFAFNYKSTKSNRFPATSEKPLTIVVDASHGGIDPGARSPDNKYVESSLSLDIAKAIEKLGKEFNVRVIMTRSNDVLPGEASTINDGLKNRLSISNEAGADAFISIHINAASPPGKYQTGFSGIEAFVSSNRNDEPGKKLASSILQQLAPVYKTSTSLKYRANQGIYVLDKINCPAVLLELGYINNAMDMEFMNSKANQETIARNILSALVNFKTNDFEIAPTTSDTVPPRQQKGSTQPKERLKIDRADNPAVPVEEVVEVPAAISPVSVKPDTRSVTVASPVKAAAEPGEVVEVAAAPTPTASAVKEVKVSSKPVPAKPKKITVIEVPATEQPKEPKQ